MIYHQFQALARKSNSYSIHKTKELGMRITLLQPMNKERMVWYGEGVWLTCICDWSESLQRRFGWRRRGMGSGFVGANMGFGFGWWRRALVVGSVLDDGECFGWRRRFDREACIGWQRSGTGKEKGNGRNRKLEFSFLYYWVLCIIWFFF